MPEALDQRHHVVMTSSGAGSAVAAKRLVERIGTERVTLLFADVNGEHPDNYRFLLEAWMWIDAELVVLDNDGRTIWDVFRETRFLGNSQIDNCSRVLKREAMRLWLEENRDPADTAVHIGYDISEEHRIIKAAPHWEPWPVDAPLCWDPPVWKEQALATLVKAGIQPPWLTRMGFPHANCGGGCIKAGMAQWELLHRVHPEGYAEWERNEEEFRQFIGQPVAIQRTRRNGVTTPITLTEFREWVDEVPTFGFDDWGSCNCVGEWDPSEEPLPEGSVTSSSVPEVEDYLRARCETPVSLS